MMMQRLSLALTLTLTLSPGAGSSAMMMQNIRRERRQPRNDDATTLGLRMPESPAKRPASSAASRARTFDTLVTDAPIGLRLVPLKIRNDVSQARLLANSVLAVSHR